MGSNKLIPNTFQHPNIYVDHLAYFLTPQEQVVLNKAIREILGWYDKIESRKARIAMSVFVDGKHSRKDGKRLCYGCGLGESAVRRALDGLHEFHVLVKTDDITQAGRMFKLQDDHDTIDWDGLQKRRNEWDKKNVERTSRARSKEGAVRQEGVLSDNRGGVLSDNRGGVLSDKDKETHLLETHLLETQLPAAPQQESPSETPEGDNGDQPVDTYLPDAKTQWDILFGPGGKRKGRSWSIPPSASGGADSLGDALLPIFCQGVDFPVEALKPKEQRQWAAELRKVAEGRGASVEQAVAALNAYFNPQGEFNWKVKSVSSPFQTGFQTDWNKLLARAVEGQPLIMTVPSKHEIRYGGRSDFPD